MIHANPDQSIGLAVYTMILLRCGERYLMLHRSPYKQFAPGLWTGIGGRVELHEMDDVYAAARREIAEETGIRDSEVHSLTLRRALVQQRPSHPVTVLLYFTGETDRQDVHQCDEGTLHWKTASEIASLDVIENTGLVLPLLMEDMRRDPDGAEPIIAGSVAFSNTGEMLSMAWSQSRG